MKKIAILGCENSHAATFLDFIYNTDKYRDVEVVGVYSNEPEAARALSEKFGVNVLDSYADAVGKIDGVVITARHGDLHYEYAKPYLDSGIPMFIDKPLTIKPGEATEFMNELKSRGIKACGGSSLKHDVGVKALKKDREESACGNTLGGFVRAPLNMNNVYGGFYFYAPHLVEVVCEVFGRYPHTVSAKTVENVTNVEFCYDTYTAYGSFVNDNYVYYACRFSDKEVKGMNLESTKEHNWFESEFNDFYTLLKGGDATVSYEDLFSSVYVMNAIEKALHSGKPEKVSYFGN
ncbi:MAG: Gfo/Idh/MocA family oxidoreductase [Clostridia bacterium]|nr:Gfo/Idh/MocA family oxidoreductase [Clostridia bacterium]